MLDDVSTIWWSDPDDIIPVCFTIRPTHFQEVLGMQRELEISMECNYGNVFFASCVKRSRGKKKKEETKKQ